MKTNSICKIIVSGLLAAVPLMGMAQQVCGNKPWSVRMAESEMVRCPESWQLDFQTRLKWDYCHGLELQAMLDVYDAYGDKKFFDYAVAYADTMIHQDGSIETYKLEEYNIDRLNSGKMLFRIYEQTKDEKYKKAVPEFVCREKVKGGLTGYAQVYGKYNTTALDKLKLDLMYVEEYSFLLDVKIVLMTVRILFQRESTEGFDRVITDEDIQREIEISKQDEND